jgi:hypothetical protein
MKLLHGEKEKKALLFTTIVCAGLHCGLFLYVYAERETDTDTDTHTRVTEPIGFTYTLYYTLYYTIYYTLY